MSSGGMANPIFLFLFGSIFAVVGIVVILFFATKTDLVCERIDKNPQLGFCYLKEVGILTKREEKFLVNQLVDVDINETEDSDGDTTYRVELIVSGNRIPLTNAYSSSYGAKEEIAQEIDYFITHPEEPILEVVEDDRLFVYLFGGIFSLVGICISMSGLAGMLKAVFFGRL